MSKYKESENFWNGQLADFVIDLPNNTEPIPESGPSFLEILEWATDDSGFEFDSKYRPSIKETSKLSDPFCSFIHTMQDMCEIHFDYFSKDPNKIMLYEGMIFGSLQARLKGNRELRIHFMYESGQQNLRAFYIDTKDLGSNKVTRVKAEGCDINTYPLTIQIETNHEIIDPISIIENILNLATFVCDKQIEDS